MGAIDKCKVSDRDVYIIIDCAEALKLNCRKYIINRSSIKKGREDFSSRQFNLKFVSIHWDSKLLSDITGCTSVDRISVIATGLKIEHLGITEL